MATPDIHLHAAAHDSSSSDDDAAIDLDKEGEYNVVLGQAFDSDQAQRVSIRCEHMPIDSLLSIAC